MMRFPSLALLVIGAAVSQVGAEEKTARSEYRLTILSRQFGYWGLVEMDVNGDRPVLLQKGSFQNPTWSPDGRRLAYSLDEQQQIHVMDADGTNVRQLTNDVHPSSMPAWSPDGKKIAFVSQVGPEREDLQLFVMNADGSNPVNLGELVDGCKQHNQPTWTRDGRRITFAATVRGQMRLLNVNADGSDAHDLLNRLVAWEAGSDWSPDGNLIVYSASDADGIFQLFVSDAQARTTRQITTGATRNWLPAWSPDGRYIAYVQYTTVDGGYHHCFVFDVLHETHTQVCEGVIKGNVYSRPAWRRAPSDAAPD